MDLDISYLYDSLTVNNILELLKHCPLDQQPKAVINTLLKRNKKRLIQTLVEEGQYWANALYEAATHKANESQHKQKERQDRRAQDARTSTGYEHQESRSTANFMELPSESEFMQRYTDTHEATTNLALKEITCAVCARLLNMISAKVTRMRFEDLPNRQRLRPSAPHHEHYLIDGCLLEEEGCRQTGDRITVNVCQECWDALTEETDCPPKFSLANNMWIGRVPWQLLCLTLAEQLLVARVYPRVFIVKLFPRDKSRFGLNNDQLQSALRGNVTSFELNSDAVAEMIKGNLMPQRPAILASVLSVTFIGKGKILNPAALQMFCVRRVMVADALLWLKNNNPKYYGDIEIKSSRLEELPPNGVPEVITINIRYEEDDTMIGAELGGYVPDSYIDDNADVEVLSPTGCPDDGAPDDATVVPIQCLGVMDNDLSKISLNELTSWGLQNMQRRDVNSRSEWGYAVRYGAPVNTFGQPPKNQPPADPNRRNYWEAAFAVLLYPHGVGGIESDRPVRVSFIEHVRWSLQYHDRRFRYHIFFIFVAFAIQQRRQALLSAKILMRRHDFDKIAHTLSTITPEDLRNAAKEEALGQKASNPAIQTLYKHIVATSRRVMGSGAARMQLRSQIFSAAMYFNQPTIWLTVNPDDLHDPIAQVFACQEINMDNFIRTAGPNKLCRSQNIARDPYAAAKFFHFTVKLIIEKLLGITSTKTRIHSTTGILGRVKAYFGTVECQGRGTLHLHMLIWLDGAPAPSRLKEMLRTTEFREKVIAYLRFNVRSFLPHLTTREEVKATPVDTEIAYSRCPEPSLPVQDLKAQLDVLERAVVRAKQIHKCEWAKCLKRDRHGRTICKRRAPWELSERDSVDTDGTYHTKRMLGELNSYCPTIAQIIKCNHDIKILLHGDETKHIGYYITKYMTKAENRSHNVASLLAERLTYHFQDPTKKDWQDRQHDLILRSVNVLNREQEIPAPLAIVNLMGWGEHHCSHYPENIYWGAFVSFIHTYEGLYPESSADQTMNTEKGATQDETQSQPIDPSIEAESSKQDDTYVEDVVLEFNAAGRIYRKSQVDDYMYRGEEATAYNVLEYFVNTYEESISRQNSEGQIAELTTVAEHSYRTMASSSTRGPGRPSHQRIRYREEHPRHRTHVRVKRPDTHNHMPNVIGPRFPRKGDPTQADIYAASILTFLKPWRSPNDLKRPNQSWEEALQEYQAVASDRVLEIIDNIEYRYEAETAAEEKQSSSYISEDLGGNTQDDDLMDVDDLSDHDGPHRISSRDITQDMINQASRELEDYREVVHGISAVRIAQMKGVFNGRQEPIRSGSNRATSSDLKSLKIWMEKLTTDPQLAQLTGSSSRYQLNQETNIGSVEPLLLDQDTDDAPGERNYTIPIQEKPIEPIEPTKLFPDQQRAFGIFDWHLMRLLYAMDYDPSFRPPQLKMLLVGPGGTGKSKVIQAITERFKQYGVAHMLVKASYTGCAASLIEGQTTHHIAQIPVGRKKNQPLSQRAKNELTKKWHPIQYLIIDEYSMLSKEFLAQLSRNISTAKLGYSLDNGEMSFGGVNVVLCGDGHQIPPVAVPLGGALYYPKVSRHFQTSVEAGIGRQIFESFEQVVVLKQQVRITDPKWQGFLDAFRRGCIKDTDVSMLESITLTNPNCVATDFESDKWRESYLITPRNSVRTRWNEARIAEHCRRTGNQLFICPAYDTCADQRTRRPITPHERYVSIKNASSARNPRKGRREKNGLPDEVSLAIGLKVMVTWNVNTDIDVTNGARGVIVDIKLSPSEPQFNESDPVVTLKEMPTYILVKLDRTRAATLSGLEEGVIPIVPASKGYAISMPIVQKDGKVKSVQRSVQRLQFPITSAYAFTDYRAQGQTISAAIVDIASPPTGELKRSNVYVALSRCSGLDNIRILRDFNHDILKKPMEIDLKNEDERLELLDLLTEQWWNRIK